MAISFALPTYTQQKDLADPQTTQKLLAGVKADEEARNNNDPAAFAANYTRDAVFLTPAGPVTGRQAIKRWNADVLQQLHPKKRAGKVDGKALHVIGTAGNELWATGEWSETGQGQNGKPLPIPIKGYDADILVREGDGWKLRVNAWNVAPDSVIAGQPAATPFSTASPSGQ